MAKRLSNLFHWLDRLGLWKWEGCRDARQTGFWGSARSRRRNKTTRISVHIQLMRLANETDLHCLLSGLQINNRRIIGGYVIGLVLTKWLLRSSMALYRGARADHGTKEPDSAVKRVLLNCTRVKETNCPWKATSKCR